MIFDFVFRRNKTRPVSHLRKHVLDIGDISLIPLNEKHSSNFAEAKRRARQNYNGDGLRLHDREDHG